jgi:serine/threonine-protein kinase
LHYRIVDKLGEGGMGQVFLAEDTRLKRRVALKVLPEALAADPARLDRFQREAEAVAALNHPNIVTLHNIEEAGATRFLTMEWVEGQSLDTLIRPGGLPLAQVFELGAAMADALAAAHDKGIVHRDFKPANVMLDARQHVKVLDFGLAKLAGEATSADQETETRGLSLTDKGTVLGTVPYMSPEQVQGRDVDARTDIFSLGTVLYEMCTGRRPFGGDNSAELISSIMRDQPQPVIEIRSDLPRHLGRIVTHCIEKDPDRRFQSMKDVRNELLSLRKEVDSGVSAGAEAAAPPLTPAAAPAASPTATGPAGHSGSVSSAISGVLPSAAERRPWITGAVVGGVLVVVVIAAFWLGGLGRSGGEGAATSGAASAAAAAESEEGSLAVLPFQNMSSDEQQEYFADGLSEELMSALAKVRGLRVAGRTSSFSFKGKQESLAVIGEQLGVAHVLEGSVRKSGDTIRVTAQLVNAATGFQLWSETYDRTLDDIFVVQDDIAASVASALELTLLGGGQPTARPDAEAYDLMLQARFALQNRTEETVARGRALLERALELNPDYAPAWAEMGLVHLQKSDLARSQEDSDQAVESARAALEKALELDPQLAVAHSRMAGIHGSSSPPDWAAARRSTDRALALNPKEPIVLGNAANLWGRLGRLDKAIELFRSALRIDPLSVPISQGIGAMYSAQRRWAESEKAFRELLKLNPAQSVAHWGIATALHEQGRSEEALREIELEPLLDIRLCYKLEILADLSRRSEAEAVLEEIEKQLPPDYARWERAYLYIKSGSQREAEDAIAEVIEKDAAEGGYYVAQLYSVMGNADEAFRWLDRAVQQEEPMKNLMADSYLYPLHSDPRWKPFLKKAGFPIDD